MQGPLSAPRAVLHSSTSSCVLCIAGAGRFRRSWYPQTESDYATGTQPTDWASWHQMHQQAQYDGQPYVGYDGSYADSYSAHTEPGMVTSPEYTDAGIYANGDGYTDANGYAQYSAGEGAYQDAGVYANGNVYGAAGGEQQQYETSTEELYDQVSCIPITSAAAPCGPCSQVKDPSPNCTCL